MSVNKYVNGKLLQLSGNADTRLTTEDIASILGYTPANPSIIENTYASLTYTNNTFVKKSDIVDNVTSTDTDKPLSANQGKSLQDQITTNTNSISTLNSNINKIGTYYGETALIMKRAASKAYGSDSFTTAFMILSMFDTDDKYFIGLVKYVNDTSYKTLAVLHASDGLSAATSSTANKYGTYRPNGFGTLAGASAMVLSVS